MKEIGWIISKIKWRYLHMSREKANDFFRREGVKLGVNCSINSNILTSESYLITIGDHVTISDHVSFVTHDNSIAKAIQDSGNLFGEIKVGANSFIGAHSIIMYGVTLAPNTIVAAGSVVTKSIHESGMIIGGNPARIISNSEKFANKNKKRIIPINGMSSHERRKTIEGNPNLIKR